MKKILLSLIIASALIPSYSTAAVADARSKKISLIGTIATVAGTVAWTTLLANHNIGGKGVFARGVLASVLTAAGLVMLLSPELLVEKYDAAVAQCCTNS